jgi:hypothetical protein
MKKTAHRRQGYGGPAYLPAEASAKAGALFDIVNTRVRSQRPRSFVQPEFGPPEFGRFALANSERGADEHRTFWRNEAKLRKRNRGHGERRAAIVEWQRPVLFPVIYRAGCVAHAGAAAQPSCPGRAKREPGPRATRRTACLILRFATLALGPGSRSAVASLARDTGVRQSPLIKPASIRRRLKRRASAPPAQA